MWEIKNATALHIRDVLADPSASTLDDLDGEPVEEAAARFIGRIARYGGDTLIVDGETVFVLGAVPTGASRAGLWFISAEAYYRLGARAVLFGRQRIKMLRQAYPDTMFISTTNSTHADVARWFSVLGFEPRGISQRFALLPRGEAHVR